MRGGVAAMAVGGVLAIAGLPAAALVAADNEFGGNSPDEFRGRAERLVLLAERGELTPRGDERRADLFPQLHEWGEWFRCVVAETRETDGAFDPEEVCGPLPEELRLPEPRELPSPPVFPEGFPKDMEDLREWMHCAFRERQQGTELENLEAKCGEPPTPHGRPFLVPDWRQG